MRSITLPRFPNESACLEELFRIRGLKEISCLKCGQPIAQHYHKLPKRKCYKCFNGTCFFEVYPMSGTIFAGSHKPLLEWFDIIHRVIETQGELSIKELQIDYGYNHRTASRILKTIREWVLMAIQGNQLPDQQFESLLNNLPPLYEHLRSKAQAA